MQINISSKIKDYSLEFYSNFDFIQEFSIISSKIVIIDKNVYNLYYHVFDNKFLPQEILLFDAIETNKNMQSVLSLADKVMEMSAKKNVTIISIGGGIVQDVTGFLASILYRGVNWFFVPTTLLAQADSCMGSKTSLNHGCFKNLLGSFYPPTKVFLNVDFTNTLQKNDFYSGMGEIVKLHLMGGEQSVSTIEKSIDLVLQQREKQKTLLSDLVHNSLKIKYLYIKDDEFDTGKRNLLNYGHCFGHALESSSGYTISHGIAVVIGMVFANIIAMNRCMLDQGEEQYLRNTLLNKCIPISLTKDSLDKEKILSAMKMDKKRVGEGLPLIVLKDSYELEKLVDLTPIELYAGIDKMIELLDVK